MQDHGLVLQVPGPTGPGPSRTGKFSTTQDGSINISITTNVQLLIDKEDIPIIKPTVHLLGKTFWVCISKIESDNSIVVPWKSKSDSRNEGSSKSVIEQRISLIQQNSTTQPSSSMTPTKNKRKTNMTKIADISRSLLLQNQQSDEIHDSETSITNKENEERINENIEEMKKEM
ncbi:hypothetical protein GLOIN_2v1772177 [Rhizophagus irregularis DAOM 181602=DAOM 197198]|nr:hypothetical protein GLOIN_2v1772177 [Rhizophagus irregularis DAOM 181602=DAOM 197198]